MSQRKEIQHDGTQEYLRRIEKIAAELVIAPDYHDPETGYISSTAWQRLVEGGILDAALLERDPTKLQEEVMRTSRMLSYHDLHLGLTYGIVAALGILPLQRFSASEEQLAECLQTVREGNLIGLAITEHLRSGSAALDMASNYEIDEESQTVKLKFAKHLQGLTGNAGMTVALLKKDAKRKTVGLFFIPQKYIKTQVTEMAGLKGICYGVNSGEVTLDLTKHLLIELPREKLTEFQDIFTKSRFLFVSMTLGHLERMEDEANKYAEKRMIEGKPQAEIPAVQGALQQIRAQREVTEALYHQVIKYRDPLEKSLLDGETTELVMQANIVKTLSTEYALQAAQLRAELAGGSAFYKAGALQDYIDIWPFQIFEGSKLFLNNQIAGAILGPTRSEGKVFWPGFFADQSNNFGEYYFQAIKHRPMFNPHQTLKNLSEWTGLMLTQITPDKAKSEIRGVIGEIVARLFALGCISDTQMEAKARLNLEIAQLAQYFAPEFSLNIP